jgi:hypothetical protein
VHLTVQPRYYADVNPIRETPVTKGVGKGRRNSGAAFGTGKHGTADGSRHLDGNPNGKLPPSVWTMPTQPLNGPKWRIVLNGTTVAWFRKHGEALEAARKMGLCDGRPSVRSEGTHFAAFPMEWPRRIIAAWCPPGGVVLDPFGGTGTTALMADVSGRTGISVDLSHDYGRVARWRTTDPKQRERAVRPPR